MIYLVFIFSKISKYSQLAEYLYFLISINFEIVVNNIKSHNKSASFSVKKL